MDKTFVYLSSCVCEQNPTLRSLIALQNRYPSRAYALTEERRKADIILLVENGYVGIRDLPTVLEMGHENERALMAMFSECDWPFAFLPGIYSSLVKILPWAFSWGFLLSDAHVNATIKHDCRYLYSFLGRLSTHPVRNGIRCLDSPLTPCLDVSDAPARFPNWDYETTYMQILRDSCFILCPRGYGASSKRVFEAMRAGRVPVIVSDAWIEPPVGNWSDFSIRVRERDIARIPKICSDKAYVATSMGELARQTFEEYFTPEKFLDRALKFICSNADNQITENSFWRVLKALSGREIRTLGHDLFKVLFLTP